MLFLRRTAFTAAAVLAIAACGDNQEVTQPDGGMMMPDSGLDEDGCRILSVGQKDFSFNLIGQLLGVKFPISQNLDGDLRDRLHIELWDSSTEGLPALTTGTFDLANQSDLATCQHCVWVDVDATDDFTLDTVYVATQGQLTVDKVSDPLDIVFAARTASRIVMRRATVGENGATTLVPDGDCVSITDLSFDTTPTPGAVCESAEDCGNALVEICDPSSNTCGDPECNFDAPCEGNNEICLIQYGDLFEGACYTACNPTTGTPGCPGTLQCVQRGPDASFGICLYPGEGAVGDACELEDNGTSCVDGAACSGISNTCASTCSFFAADTGCAAGTACSIFSLCEPPSAGNAAAIGEACGDSAVLADPCGSDGEAFRGLCFAYEDDPLMCGKTCYLDQGCGDGEFCAQRFSTGVGLCLPNPVCGDGQLGEINEICDDGNQNDNDGCVDNCQTVGYDFLCNAAPTIVLGATQQDSTALGIDGFQSSCQPGIAKAILYEVAPPGPGRLRVRLTSDSAQSLSVRTDCTDTTTELECEGELGLPTDKEIVVQITETTPAPLSLIVSAMTVLEQGMFTLETEFTDEDCGDGVIAGREVCDDGNEDGNDGCSADCRAIEYDYFCSEAPTLSTSASNAGTLIGAPALYPATCTVDDGDDGIFEAHPSQLFVYTAPAAGTLALKLTDGTSFAVLSVRDGCSTPDTAVETACRPAFLDGEIQVTLGEGESITAVVSSYFLDDGIGTFTLDATFTAQ